ncbi:MAG: glycosyltransferase 61 family protein [Myxococcota bacterium]
MLGIETRSLRHLVRRLFAADIGPLEAGESRLEVICEAERGERLDAVFLPEQLERVRRTQEDTSYENELVRLSAGPVTHDASIAVQLKNARLVEGVVFADRVRCPLTHERFSSLRTLRERTRVELGRAAIPSSTYGSRYFAHRILDDAVSGLAARKLAPVFWADDGKALGEHVRTYLRAVDLPERSLRNADIDELWLFPHDYALNSHKTERIRALRRSVQRLATDGREGHGVFLRRRGGGLPRGLTNERELEARLAAKGFEIVDVPNLPAAEIQRRCRGASVVAGVEGSAFTHALLGAPLTAALVPIMPPFRFNNYFKDFTDVLGMTYGFVVGKGSEEAFEVDVDELLETMDLAVSAAARRHAG